MKDARAFIGVDLADRYSRSPRPNDVCILTGSPGAFFVRFDRFSWSRESLNEKAVLDYLRNARAVYIDGPQGRAEHGRTRRDSERLVRAPGPTPETLPALSRPFAGFVRSSVELFDALWKAGARIENDSLNGLQEVYPGGIWAALLKGIDKKGTASGRLQREAILAELGVLLPDRKLTDDQRDAAIAAVLAAAANGLVDGLDVVDRGEPARWDSDAGFIREGRILMPVVSDALRHRIKRTVESGTVSSTKQAHPASLTEALVSRVARVAVGPSVVRGSREGTVASARARLRTVDLSEFGTSDAEEFSAALDKWTNAMRRALPGDARWGLARKVLNIFIRDAVYNAHLRAAFHLDQCEPLCELPMDRIVAKHLASASVTKVPKWEGVNELGRLENALFQKAASEVAAAIGVHRLHLDSFWWSQSRDEE